MGGSRSRKPRNRLFSVRLRKFRGKPSSAQISKRDSMRIPTRHMWTKFGGRRVGGCVGMAARVAAEALFGRCRVVSLVG